MTDWRTRFGKRMKVAYPHAGALLAGLVVLVTPGLLPNIESESDVVGWVIYLIYWAILMLSPALGAVFVLRLQNKPVDWRGPVIRPYLYWGLAGIIVLPLLIVFDSLRSNDSPALVAVGETIFGTLYIALGVAVPLFVPFLRMIMWVWSPPGKAAEEVTPG